MKFLMYKFSSFPVCFPQLQERRGRGNRSPHEPGAKSTSGDTTIRCVTVVANTAVPARRFWGPNLFTAHGRAARSMTLHKVCGSSLRMRPHYREHLSRKHFNRAVPARDFICIHAETEKKIFFSR